MGRGSTGLISLVATALIAGCSPAADAEVQGGQGEVAAHPVSGLAIVPVVVAGPDGSHEFRAELANTPQSQAQGLMYRTELGPDEAMIFPSDQPTARAFWMKNTPIPLDIIFVGLDGRISNIAAMTEPYSEKQVYSVGSASAVLEIAGGRAAELGIEPGDRVSW
ncbi:DUF192 domain-containing protein [Qipengyuania sp. GH1]|uniref:DUF192 domain-containing protein n=1 Tax=Qipengyuania aestuarii TaxID=2867241 RepID=UPI001C8768EE|nr:DUF192 domain-containing protein [Qipengyuania aestuarii]MBX7536235.1 DUF192 domain-containing protein [Qipengyuania aestuarii]